MNTPTPNPTQRKKGIFISPAEIVLLLAVIGLVYLIGNALVGQLMDSAKRNVYAEPLYRDGITPAANSDDGFTGEIIKLVTPTKSKVVMLGIRQSVQPDSETNINVRNAVFFAIGDDTMQVGDKVHVKKYWHVPHNQGAQSYSLWMAMRIGGEITNKR